MYERFQRLTPSEREQFERDGYVVLRNALSCELVERVLAIALDEDAQYRARPEIGPHHVLNLHDLIGRDAIWLELIDHPQWLARICELLGWNIQLFHTQLIVTPPAPANAVAGAYGWHQDNNRMNRDLDCTPQPRIWI